MKVKFVLSIGFPTAKHTEIVDLDDEDYDTDEAIEEAYQEWVDNLLNGGLDGGWERLNG